MRSRECSVFVTNRLKMLTLLRSIGDLFETSKTYSEKEHVGGKILKAVLGLTKPDNDEHCCPCILNDFGSSSIQFSLIELISIKSIAEKKVISDGSSPGYQIERSVFELNRT